MNNHPHIVTIYSVEHTDGVHFLTMEVVEGQSLDALICPDGLAVDQIVTIAAELADALSAAHDKGIVHRDLKPCEFQLPRLLKSTRWNSPKEELDDPRRKEWNSAELSPTQTSR